MSKGSKKHKKCKKDKKLNESVNFLRKIDKRKKKILQERSVIPPNDDDDEEDDSEDGSSLESDAVNKQGTNNILAEL